jgi:hypothetical protein
LKDCGPVPGECLSLIVPLGNFSVSVVLPVVMSTPPAVNTPWAITVSLVAVAEVDMNWKCSIPEALLLLGAAVAARVPDRAIAPAASMEPAAISRRKWVLRMVRSPHKSTTPGLRAAGTGPSLEVHYGELACV